MEENASPKTPRKAGDHQNGQGPGRPPNLAETKSVTVPLTQKLYDLLERLVRERGTYGSSAKQGAASLIRDRLRDFCPGEFDP